ncbi:MAG: flagellar biosynthetic protein FliR [Candidatus Gastranaerophilales bacterium]|nr:flagellar biosynthetic protein FliR [Candidatus Gastranaerophilales bacterium]
MEEILKQFSLIFPEINTALGSGIMVFLRIAGLYRFAPVFSRTEVPVIVRMALALITTIIVVGIIKPTAAPADCPIMLCMILNFLFGAIIGYVANCILAAVLAGGDMINTQMGLSSAMVMDPSTRTQVSVMANYFSTLAMLIFMYSGGVYWMFNAIVKSFSLYPMYAVNFHFEKIVNVQFLGEITGNVLFVGLHLAGPVLLATLGQDIILGIISKTAPQVNVFSLSFLFKPVMGAFILIVILPMLINVITDYLVSNAAIL